MSVCRLAPLAFRQDSLCKALVVRSAAQLSAALLLLHSLLAAQSSTEIKAGSGAPSELSASALGLVSDRQLRVSGRGGLHA